MALDPPHLPAAERHTLRDQLLADGTAAGLLDTLLDTESWAGHQLRVGLADLRMIPEVLALFLARHGRPDELKELLADREETDRQLSPTVLRAVGERILALPADASRYDCKRWVDLALTLVELPTAPSDTVHAVLTWGGWSPDPARAGASHPSLRQFEASVAIQFAYHLVRRKRLPPDLAARLAAQREGDERAHLVAALGRTSAARWRALSDEQFLWCLQSPIAAVRELAVTKGATARTPAARPRGRGRIG